MKRSMRVLSVVAVLALSACRQSSPEPQGAISGPDRDAAAVAPVAEPIELVDVVETDPRYIIGISFPPAVNKYPGLAADLKTYADGARAELMEAVAGLEGEAGSAMYDLALEFKVIADTPDIFAVAADGSSYTGGAHGAPLIARFVWLPREQRRLRASELIPDPDAWREVSSFVREQLHAALSQRVDADELDPGERERVIRSAARMIEEGSAPDAENFTEFEPVIGANGRLAALRFVFPPYQVGPYSDGEQTVEVPAELLLPHVAQAYRALFAGSVAAQ